MGTKVILSIKDSNVRNFIFSSTAAVYKDGLTKVTERSTVGLKVSMEKQINTKK